ncbi:MAG TPA: T9SS type A sorting domain-containing protein, partial [Chitinophagaceae bacterium]|nr:T9SS type A sorting domain-containing protein [Chitinophagaceae bacterium]
NPTPMACQDTISSCESPISSNSAQFCLDSIVGAVSCFGTGVDVNFYGDQSLFLPITPTCYHTSSTNYIYSKVTIPSTGCYSSDTVYLEVIPTPQFLANPLVGNACAPACIDVASLINPFTPAAGSDTLYYEDPACTIPHPNPHCVFNVDTIYIVFKTPTIPYCSDTTTAYINIIPALNYIVNQDTFLNFSICGSVGCNNITLADGNLETAFTSTDCRKVASVKDLANGVSLGSTSVCEEIDCSVQFHNGQPYVNRNYQITPSVNDSAEVCLYYLAQDFADFEAAAIGASWPSPFMDPFSTLCITQVDNGNIYTPGHTAISIPNSAITPSFDPLTQVWQICFKVDSFSYFYCSTCNPLNIPLPVSLSSFTGKRVNGISELKWTTASERNNDYFVVQRGKDAKSFSNLSNKINTKAVNGNSTSAISYSFDDMSPFNGHNYYRLQQVDIDGNTSYSEILDIYFGEETMVTLYPNPVNDVLNFEINTPKSSSVMTKIMDATGRVVKTVEMYLQAGNNINQVDMKSLADGMYMISITNNRGLNYTQTVRKN